MCFSPRPSAKLSVSAKLTLFFAISKLLGAFARERDAQHPDGIARPSATIFLFCYELLYLVLRLEHDNQLRSLRRLHSIDTWVVNLNYNAVGSVARALNCGSTVLIDFYLSAIN